MTKYNPLNGLKEYPQISQLPCGQESGWDLPRSTANVLEVTAKLLARLLSFLEYKGLFSVHGIVVRIQFF